jgi:integrase
LKKGIIATRVKITVSQWLDTWLETYAKVRVRQNTYEDYKRIVEGHLKPSIGSFNLKDLRPEQVQKMLNQKLASGRQRDCGEHKKGGPLSPRTVELIFTVLHSALEQAVKNQTLIRNICNAVDKPKKSKNEFIPWTTEQMNHFLSSTKASRLFPVYITEWGTGLRRSELLGLKWEDIDLKRGMLTVRRAMVRVKSGYVFGDPKTKKSKRTIPLPERVTKELKAWKKRQAAENVAFEGEYNPLNLVFCNEAGQPMNPDFVSRSFKKDLEDAELPVIRFHDLRHGHATMLLELGENLKVVSDRLGHHSVAMTGDTYSHVQEKIQKEASNKLDKALKIK